MTVRPITCAELDTVLGWARAEGWNPGLEDAAAFHAADPGGFFVKRVDGAPVAAVSVVNHDDDFAFLGLYLCLPAFRGQGHGMEVWTAAMAHAGARRIGLDGVPDQQANYARSGFDKHGRTMRYAGRFEAVADARVRVAGPSDLSALCARDRAQTGMARTRFARAWFAPAETRQTVVLDDAGQITGSATFRRCAEGVKIGPLSARTPEDARALLGACPWGAQTLPHFIDVADANAGLTGLLGDMGCAPVFETARMFRGAPPDAAPAPFQAIATMELG